MAEFSAGAVMTMLGIVEATVITLHLYQSRRKADEDDLDDVAETAEAALTKAKKNKRDVARVERSVEARADGGTPTDHE